MSSKRLIAGRYELIDRLGQGGMAEVYRGRSVGAAGFTRIVAVKRILSHLTEDPEMVSLFVDEAKVAAAMSHPNIVQIFDLLHEEDGYYIVMEHVDGIDVERARKQCANSGRPFPLVHALFVVHEVCKALHYAHNRSDETGRPLEVIHRDVSPSNILVAYDAQVKLVDFGIAKAATRHTQTAVGQIRGKLQYMSPEQIQGLRLDARSDLYSLGVVFYELITGERLYKKKPFGEMRRQIAFDEVGPPSVLRHDVPPELDDICLRAMAKNREERYQSAREFQEAILRILHNLPPDMISPDVGSFFRQLAAEMAAESGTPPPPPAPDPRRAPMLAVPLPKPPPAALEGPKTDHRPQTMHEEVGEEHPPTPAERQALEQQDQGWAMDAPPPPKRQSWAFLGIGFVIALVGGLLYFGAFRPASEVAAAAPQTPVPSTGYLTIRSQPIARVYLDGEPTGRTTPVVEMPVSAGMHSIKLVNQRRRLTKELQVLVPPQEVKELDLKLSPQDGAP